jgi:hypothetical protein
MNPDNEQSRESPSDEDKYQREAFQFLSLLQSQDKEAIEKKIFEEDIEYTEALQILFQFQQSLFFNEVRLMFEKREVNKALNRDLKYNDAPDKRPKI